MTARSGDVLEHPVTGERLVWRRVASDTAGELLEADLFAQPGAFVAAEHVHPNQEERFEVVSGAMAVRIGGEERTLRRGDVAVIPPGRPHTWWNAGSEEVHVRGEVQPALRTEQFFEKFFGLAKDGKTNRRGLPSPLQLALLMREYDQEIRLARPPFLIQRLLFTPLAVIARLVGYRASTEPPTRGNATRATRRNRGVPW